MLHELMYCTLAHITVNMPAEKSCKLELASAFRFLICRVEEQHIKNRGANGSSNYN